MGYLLEALSARSLVSGETLEELGHIAPETSQKYLAAIGADDDDG